MSEQVNHPSHYNKAGRKECINKSGVMVIDRKEVDGSKIKRFVCRCTKCGGLFEMWSSHFYRGSNGCKCENFRKKYPRLYGVWTNIKTRCQNKENKNFKNYGARGILLCKEWQEFEPFMKWAYANGYDENAPKGQCTIDRIDVNGNYCPENCRWVNMEVQSSNKRDSILYELDGEVMCLRAVCRKTGINYKTEYDYYSKNGYKKELLHLRNKAKCHVISAV